MSSTIAPGATRVRTQETHELLGAFTAGRSSSFACSGIPIAVEQGILAGTMASDGTSPKSGSGPNTTTLALRGRRKVRVYALSGGAAAPAFFVGFDANVSLQNGIPVWNTPDGFQELLVSEFVQLWVVGPVGTLGVLFEEAYA